jgi:hypothetical protein
MIFSLALPLLLLTGSSAAAQIQGDPIAVDGTCDSKTGVVIDDGEMARFACDSAVLARTDRGTVLIQFAAKHGDDRRILGFAGTLEGKQDLGAERVQMMAVERLYLAGGATPIPTDRGTCFINWSGSPQTGGHVTSLICGGAGQAEGSEVKAMAGLKVR